MTNKPDLMPQQAIPPLSVQAYQRYNPSAFNDSLTILEKLNKMIYQLNQLGKLSNSLVDNWNELVKWILGNGLNEIVSEEIDKRIADGTFDNLFNGILGDLANLTTVDKTTIVNAINEINAIALNNQKNIGELPTLITDEKDNLVVAINEIKKQTVLNTQGPIMVAESTGHGVISGFKVTQQKVLAMAVDIGDNITPNIIHMENGDRFVLDSISLAVDPSDATLTRKDIIYVNKDGEVSYLAGVASLSPQPPVLPQGGELLAVINVEPTDTTVNNIDITDKRALKALTFLKTSAKDNLVNAINEVLQLTINNGNATDNKIGDMTQLPTTDKTTIVNAIIEVVDNMNKLDQELTQDIQDVLDKIGDLTNLQTSDKSTIVNSINSLKQYVDSRTGDLTLLPTQAKSNLVDSIIEIYQKMETGSTDVSGKIGDLNLLPTTDKTNLVNSIIEVVKDYNDKIGDLSLLPTSIKTNIVLSITEIFNTKLEKTEFNSTIGDLTQLNTADKSNIVNAINDVIKDSVAKIGDLTALKTNAKDNLVNSINEVYDGMSSAVINGIKVLVINVKDFGAKGDGLTDDTKAIQNAFDSVTKGVWGGGTVYFPQGTYKVTAPIRLDQTGLIVKGYSPSASRIIAGAPNIEIFKANVAHRLKIQDIMVDGAGMANIKGLAFFGTAGIEVNNVWIDSCENGIYTNDVYFAKFDTIRIFGTKEAYMLTSASNVITLQNCYSLTTRKALTWYSSSTLTIIGSSFEGFSTLSLYNVQGYSITSSYWEGMHNQPTDAYSFLELGNATGGLAQGGTVSGNFFLAYTSFGIIVYGVNGLDISGNYFATTEGGIVLSGETLATKQGISIGANTYDIKNQGHNEKLGIIYAATGDIMANNTAEYKAQAMRFPIQKEVPSVALNPDNSSLWWNGTNLMVKFKDAGGIVHTKTIQFVEDLPKG